MTPKKRAFPWVAVALVAVVAVVAIATMALRRPSQPKVLTAPAVVADLEKAVLATGTLQPHQVINVGSQVSGQIMAVNVDLGDRVKQGDLLAVIDATQLEIQLRNTQTQTAAIRNNVGQIQAQLTLAENNMRRQERLKEAGVGAAAQYDQAQSQVRNMRATLAMMENNVKSQELNVEAAKANLDKANIRAPISGLVAEIVSRQGQTINASQVAPTILKLANTDKMTVRTQISEADIIRVKPGQTVYFTLLGDPSRRYYAKLRTVELTPTGGVLDPNSGAGAPKSAVYYNALFDVPNPGGALLAGMTAEVHVVLDEAKRVLAVPLTALGPRDAQGRYSLQVMDGKGRMAERKVTVGLTNSAMAEIRDGLKAGEQVVIGQAEPGRKDGARRDGLLSGLTVAQR